MQHYGQTGCQRPGSATGFAGQQGAPPAPPLPPGYTAPHPYQPAVPRAYSQWAASTPTNTSNPWSQSQQQAGGGYNPVTYGTMPGGSQQSQSSYAHQQYGHDQPPPPPPKPHGLAAAVQQQQNSQSWYQSGYNNAAPSHPATSGGFYHSSTQGGRPGSMYGQAVFQQTAPVVNPNEQQSAYIPPPSVQTYMPPNTNPTSGTYGPPRTDTHPWQQTQHAPPQGGMKFTHANPTVNPTFHSQSYWETQHPENPPPLPPRLGQQPNTQSQQQPPPQYGQPAHDQFSPHTQMPQGPPFQSQPLQQQQQSRLEQTVRPQQQLYGQSQDQAQSQQHTVQSQYEQVLPEQQTQQHVQYPQPQNQWQYPHPPESGFGQPNAQISPEPQRPMEQSQWQPVPQAQGQQYCQMPVQGIKAPKPHSPTDTSQSDFFQPTPQSQPVSPISNRPSLSSASGQQSAVGRPGSVSSVALANFHAQRPENKTVSPKPIPLRFPTSPPPRDDKSKFSVLGTGGPSDWERFWAEEEVDDEELFRAKTSDKEDKPAQLHSVELPAHVPSPPSTHGRPSPAAHVSSLDSGIRQDSYVPTPPFRDTNVVERPSPPSPQQSFIVEDAVVAPLRTTPKPPQNTQPPAQNILRQQPSVMTGSTADKDEWNTSRNSVSSWDGQSTDISLSGLEATNSHYAEGLAAKDEVIERLRADFERERTNLNAEIAMLRNHNHKLESDLEAAKAYTAEETQGLRAQIETMSQANFSSDASAKETDLTIERLKEDAEGREHNIEERDNAIIELKRQLEAEKTKELPKPTVADLVSDIDPWYIGSLERYITMLRGEASEPQIDGKIKIFKAFMEAESGIRGIDCYNTQPRTTIVEPHLLHEPEQTARSQGASNASIARQDLTVQIPEKSPIDDHHSYSPGGRPILIQQVMLPPVENSRAQSYVASSVASTTILTPTSSVDDDANKTPVQSLPETPQYKAYVPLARIADDHVSPMHRHTMSFSSTPGLASPPGRSSSGNHDEVFFGNHRNQDQSSSKPIRSDSTTSDVPIPAPLSLSPRRPVSTGPMRKDPIVFLAELIPSRIHSVRSSNLVEQLRTKLGNVDSHADNHKELMTTWEKSASLNRRKKDDARRKRQEEGEEHNNDLFNCNEISYAELNQLEQESKHKEGELKAQEGREEYQDYMGIVFSKVYHGLQAEIKVLTDLYVEAQDLLRTSVSGMKSLGDPDVPTTAECLELLKVIHEQVEGRHEGVVQAVGERDRRYKRTETQPLYVAGDITRMKSHEKHFENAEKQATLKAKGEKADRMGDLVSFVEDIVFDAVSTEQAEINRIITAIKELDDGTADSELLSRAQETLGALKLSSETLLSHFNVMEIEHNNAVLDVDIAQARVEGADAGRLQELEIEKQRDVKKMTEEFERRVGVLNQIDSEVAELMQRKVKGSNGEGKGGEDMERDRRLRMALEEAKRRNGHA